MEQQNQSISQPQLDSNFFQQEKDENTPESEVSQVYMGPEKDELSPDKSLGIVKTIHKLKHTKKKYHSISDENRQKLIDAVENRGEKIKHAAKRLSINYSSAKSICQIFKKEGRTDKKAFKKRREKEEAFNDINIKPAMTASITSLHSLDFGSDAIQNAETMSFSEKQEKDTLKMLRDRLLESRGSRLKQHYQSDGEIFQQVKKENIDQHGQYRSQLQQLDDVIAQNNRLLGESPEAWKKSFMTESSLSDLKSQSTLSPMQGSMEVIQSETLQNNFSNNMSPPQNVQNSLSKQIININQPQAWNVSIQNFGSNDNNFNRKNPQTAQQNPPFPQHFNSQQLIYLPQVNANQGLGFNPGMNQALLSNSQRYPNGLPVYQPIVYLVAQPNPNQVSAPQQLFMNGTGNFINKQIGLGQANNNNLGRQNFSIFQKPMEGNPYMLGNEMHNRRIFE